MLRCMVLLKLNMLFSYSDVIMTRVSMTATYVKVWILVLLKQRWASVCDYVMQRSVKPTLLSSTNMTVAVLTSGSLKRLRSVLQPLKLVAVMAEKVRATVLKGATLVT